jgi:predicted dehydrogenase
LVEKAAAGGGPMHNLGVHWIDLFRWLLGDEVESATGMVSHVQHNLEVEDNSFGTIRFHGGATATLDISYSVPGSYPAGRDLFISVRGSKGALSWSPAWGGTADEVFVVSDDASWADGPVRTLQIGSRDVQGYGGVSGLAYLRDVAKAIATGHEPEVTGIDGLRAMEVVEAIYRSAETGEATQVQQVD